MQFLTGCCRSMPEAPAFGGSWLCRMPSHRSLNFRNGPLAPESAVLPFEVSHLLRGHPPHVYRILFTIEDNTVFVLHIRHGRRQPLMR